MAVSRATTNRQADQGRGLPALVRDLWQMVVSYLKQETVGPIRNLGRFVGFGLAGSAVLSVGLVLVVLGLLRILQTELGIAFDGTWSWFP